jgi:MATE family multidrug resistance protein
MALALFAVIHGRARRRALVRWSRPRLATMIAMLRLGLPIGGSSAVESGLFFAVALLIGLLGPAALAAQQVSLNTVSIAFMIPLGLSQAANVRVAHRVGAGDHGGARTAGLVAIALGALSELVFASLSLLAPHQIVSLYLDPADTEAFRIAVGLLGVAAMFQVADGIQCVASGALRGLGDTSVPFALAAIGYWGIGFPAAWLLTFQASLGASGAWLGLAAGLTVTAALLTSRFVHRSRRTLAPVIGD